MKIQRFIWEIDVFLLFYSLQFKCCFLFSFYLLLGWSFFHFFSFVEGFTYVWKFFFNNNHTLRFKTGRTLTYSISISFFVDIFDDLNRMMGVSKEIILSWNADNTLWRLKPGFKLVEKFWFLLTVIYIRIVLGILLRHKLLRLNIDWLILKAFQRKLLFTYCRIINFFLFFFINLRVTIWLNAIFLHLHNFWLRTRDMLIAPKWFFR